MQIDKQKSVAVVGRSAAIPRPKRVAVALWQLIASLALIGGVIYAFFAGWYWALLGFITMFIIAKANQNTAANFIAETARENPVFEAEMRRASVILD
ncbi:MAG: hypothetical protein M9945_02255 [Aquamicrobium sp.]|uniref:hypothetical protein n=1 Tax=Aquamicrobium sp. TaxID=1872579 RepID=UPI00349E7C3D|nr:hypothetical protein [Aquamicrobium sp.]